jgi:hypothetical protein
VSRSIAILKANSVLEAEKDPKGLTFAGLRVLAAIDHDFDKIGQKIYFGSGWLRIVV